jgi:hypothetical protein
VGNFNLKYMLSNVGKIFLVLFVVDVLFFVGMIVTSMTDEPPPSISKFFYWTLKYILGFPLVIIKGEYPFFLDSKHMPVIAFFLIALNNLILSMGIWKIRKLFN